MDTQIILFVGAALLGAILGSFINALSFRFNTGRSILWTHSTSLRASRSRCMRCGHTLGGLDLVPVLSFVFLRGRCRYCGSKISWQYPLVELVAALLSALTYLSVAHLGTAALAYAFWLLVWMIVLFTIIYDIKHTVIPWSCSISLAVLALVSFVVPVGQAAPSLWALLAGPLLALPLFFISLISAGRWMGGGDSAFELSLGWLLGLSAGLSALMLAFWSGALVGIALLVAGKHVTMKSEIPFAPFLALGALLAYFLHVDFFSSLSTLF